MGCIINNPKKNGIGSGQFIWKRERSLHTIRILPFGSNVRNASATVLLPVNGTYSGLSWLWITIRVHPDCSFRNHYGKFYLWHCKGVGSGFVHFKRKTTATVKILSNRYVHSGNTVGSDRTFGTAEWHFSFQNQARTQHISPTKLSQIVLMKPFTRYIMPVKAKPLCC